MDAVNADIAAFRRIADVLPTPAWALDPDGVLVWVNRAAAEFVGRARSTLDPAGWGVVHPDDRSSVERSLAEAMALGERIKYEHRILRADGQYRWMGVDGGPVRDADGNVIEWVGITIDIDEPKRAMTLLDALFSQAPVGLAYVDREARYVRINETLAAINGLPVEEHVGRMAAEIVPGLWPRIAPAFTRVRDRGEPVLNHEVAGQTAAAVGVTRHWLVSYYPVRTGPEVAGVGVVAIDETARKCAEIEMARLSEERRTLLAALVRAQERERRTVAANIHADTLQVFAAVRLKVEELGEAVHEPDQRAAVAQVEEALAAAQGRLRTLLFELWPPSLERSGLRVTIEELLSRLEADAGVRTQLEFGLDAEPPPDLRGTLFRVVAEALANARRHASAALVNVSLTQRDGKMTLRVSDDGVGFDASCGPDLGHFGLLEMGERMRAMGGELEIRSAPGRGTTIVGTVPVGARGT
jgi:PAS domain S-box-containing protein